MKKIIIALLALMPLTTMAQKFGHVDAQSIMQSMPDFIKVRGELEAEQKQYENEMQEMQKELQTKAEEFDKNKATMPESKQKEVSDELNQLYQTIQQAYQDNQQKLQKSYQEKLQPVQQKLENAIKAVGKNGSYVYIFDLSMGIPYVSDTLSKDVTSDVKAELNKMK